MATYDASEQDVLLQTFLDMLRAVTKDGGRKRAKGEKPPWWRDSAHEAAIFSHLNKWKHGEREDKDSGTHPLVHMAWRALAIAYQEMYGQVDPAGTVKYQQVEAVPTGRGTVWNAGTPSSDIRCYSCGASVFDGEDHSRCRGTA